MSPVRSRSPAPIEAIVYADATHFLLHSCSVYLKMACFEIKPQGSVSYADTDPNECQGTVERRSGPIPTGRFPTLLASVRFAMNWICLCPQNASLIGALVLDFRLVGVASSWSGCEGVCSSVGILLELSWAEIVQSRVHP